MKKEQVVKIFLLILLLGFNLQLNRLQKSVKAQDSIRDTTVTTVREEIRGEENQTAGEIRDNRNTQSPREDRDTEGLRDRESILCDPKFGGKPELCITPQAPSPTITPTPGPQGGPEGPTPTPTPGPPGPSDGGDDGDGDGDGGVGGPVGEIKGLSFAGGSKTTENLFFLFGIVCIFNGLRLLRISRQI